MKKFTKRDKEMFMKGLDFAIREVAETAVSMTITLPDEDGNPFFGNLPSETLQKIVHEIIIATVKETETVLLTDKNNFMDDEFELLSCMSKSNAK